MKVKIGNKTYDSNDEPIMLILEEEDKNNISNMGEQTKYCSFPEDIDTDTIIKFMKEINGTVEYKGELNFPRIE